MAPEILPGKRLLPAVTQDDLLKADIWSLGMVFYAILNPSSTPFDKGAKESPTFKPQRPDEFVGGYYDANIKPSFSKQYAFQQASYWSSIVLAYCLCTNFEASKRPSCAHDDSIDKLLQVKEPRIIQLDVSQATISERFDKEIAQDKCIKSLPRNDGTNCCAFLCYKLASNLWAMRSQDDIFQALPRMVEDTILEYPVLVNKPGT